MKKRIQYFVFLAWLGSLVMLMSGCRSKELIFEEQVLDETMSELSETVESSVNKVIYVHVCGEVKVPGVYEAPAGSRYQDFINLAGGMTDEAARDYLNLAKVAEDGEKIRVPGIHEVSESFGTDAAVDDGKVNLNTATRTELMTLPGIGEAKAGAIIAYREEVGNFAVIEDVMKVAGIKDAAFSQIKEYIKVK